MVPQHREPGLAVQAGALVDILVDPDGTTVGSLKKLRVPPCFCLLNGDVKHMDLPQEIGTKMVISSELMEMLKLMYDKCGEHNSNNYALC